jgi:uncharacterized protein YcsI (UPF0317 family)
MRGTSGLAPGKVQAKLIILPRIFADDFLLYCMRTRIPLPQVVASQHGVPAIPQLAEIDLRGDVPATKSIASAHSLGSRQTSPPVAGKFRGLSRSARA